MSTTTRMSSVERRAAIIDTAMRLFGERGFRGVTTRELAAAVGVSEPVLYQHFPSKRDLYTAIIETVMGSEVEMRLPVVLNEPSYDVRQVFHTLAKLAFEWHVVNANYVRLIFFAALEKHELAELAYQRHEVSFCGQLRQYVQGQIAAGHLRQANADAIMFGFLGIVSDAAKKSIFFPNACPQGNPDLSEMIDLYLDGIVVQRQ
ncbi:MAG: TetR/AcrR family transcriptional regulator [Bryobacteraceae bacterium]|nr:TetR/AcrR family transcriptional regulator [Bryobacteraceae bacterium]